MSFWEKALGGAVPTAPRTVPQTSHDAPWWQTSFLPPSQPQMVQPYQQVQIMEQQPAPVVTSAPSARSTQTCPHCGSGNYTKGDTAGSMTRCFECGYNPRFDQMAFAATGGQPTKATVQAASTQSGFHGNIQSASQAVGRVTV